MPKFDPGRIFQLAGFAAVFAGGYFVFPRALGFTNAGIRKGARLQFECNCTNNKQS
jgi:hypothetical protein